MRILSCFYLFIQFFTILHRNSLLQNLMSKHELEKRFYYAKNFPTCSIQWNRTAMQWQLLSYFCSVRVFRVSARTAQKHRDVLRVVAGCQQPPSVSQGRLKIETSATTLLVGRSATCCATCGGIITKVE